MDRLEKHIKEKLNNRTLPPSPEAWEKISSQLAHSKKEGSTIPRYWWAVAAVGLGILVLSVGLLRKESIVIPENGVVLDHESTEERQSIEKQGDTDIETPTATIDLETVVDEEVAQKEPEFNGQEKETEFAIVAQESSKNESPALNDQSKKTELAINSKLEEVLAQVAVMEQNAQVVTDSEIDSLLLAAQKELLTEQSLFQKDGKVDALALLNEVELELYDDERNPLFIRLKEGFFKLRTAVADRNN